MIHLPIYSRKCSSCDGDCIWSDDAWTCTACGDEWSIDHDPKYGPPADAGPWELITSEGRTVYHRRTVGPLCWLTVKRRAMGDYRWVRHTTYGGTRNHYGRVLDCGNAATWQAARSAADRSAR